MSGAIAVACLLGIIAITYGIPVPLLAATAVLVAGAAWRGRADTATRPRPAAVAVSTHTTYAINGRYATAEEYAQAMLHAWPKAQAHVAELEAAVDRVRRLHSQDTSLLAPGKWCPGCGEEEPCRTIRALNGQAR